MRLPDLEEQQKWAGRILLWGELLLIGAFVIFRFYVAHALSVQAKIERAAAQAAPVVQPDPVDITFALKRGNFLLHRYTPGQPAFAARPRAVIIFGSGDGGFDGWEDRVCRALQAAGYEMLGFDCASYAQTDYTLAILQADMNTIAQSSLAKYGDTPPPLILGGWSMGAEQAVPAGGGPRPPADLAGLLLISPGARGRYGLRTEDKWNIQPTGAGTFALADFAGDLGRVRVAQWVAKLDLLGSNSWLSLLSSPHKEFDFTFGFHDYNGASDQFLAGLKQSIAWILAPPDSAANSSAGIIRR